MINSLLAQGLSNLERMKLETLITIQVHQRDVFEDVLVKNKVKDPEHFDWQKQCRLYWRSERDECVVCITDVENDYCYEYLGCRDRLVVTPLTG